MTFSAVRGPLKPTWHITTRTTLCRDVHVRLISTCPLPVHPETFDLISITFPLKRVDNVFRR